MLFLPHWYSTATHLKKMRPVASVNQSNPSVRYLHLFSPPTVFLFPVEDNGTAVVLSAVAGSGVQGTAVSETLHVPEPFSVARHPLLQDGIAFCSRCH